jgi:glycosyltransferase involved in cell wall biosynthesis
MRIVVVSDTFSPHVGYAEQALPKALSAIGADVHVVTTRLPPYYNMKDFEKTYGGFTSDNSPRKTEERIDGYTVHYLDHSMLAGSLRIKGLHSTLSSLRPEIVQIFSPTSWVPLELALLKPVLGYKLFTGNHTTASVFPLARRPSSWWSRARVENFLIREACGRVVSSQTELCFAATKDCADVAVRFLGVPFRKVVVTPLGVDTDLFSPAVSASEIEARRATRSSLGFGDSDIVCIYTGRFTVDKNPLLLAQAIDALGAPFKGLFVGNGVQRQEISELRNCKVHPFVPVHELSRLFHAADIGVWPTQESTSMLDAAACGIPIVVNDTLAAVERIEGNGLTYRKNDVASLIQVLSGLKDPAERERLGRFGASKMKRQFSWASIAKGRLSLYEQALNGRPLNLPDD